MHCWRLMMRRDRSVLEYWFLASIHTRGQHWLLLWMMGIAHCIHDDCPFRTIAGAIGYLTCRKSSNSTLICAHYLCAPSSAPPSPLSRWSSSLSRFAMTCSNCDQSPSTWLNSLPTYQAAMISMAVNSSRSTWGPYCDDTFQTSIEFVHVL